MMVVKVSSTNMIKTTGVVVEKSMVKVGLRILH